MLTVHDVYIRSDLYMPDYQRESFSRLRLMSHNLRIKTGRWSRTPAEQRLCFSVDSQVQTERHVLVECPLTARGRARYSMLSFASVVDLMNDNSHIKEVCSYVSEVLSIYT